MSHVYREVRHTSVREPDVARRDDDYAVRTVAGIVSLLGGVVVTLLGLRVVLSLLGADRDNVFASFVYSVTHPFIAPFLGLFNYQEQIGVVRFEFEALVAIVFWAFVTWMVVRLITIGNHD